MKDVLFITHFAQIPGEKGNNRFYYIISNIDKTDMEIEVVTTNFSHKNKTHRIIDSESVKQEFEDSIKFTLLNEPSYGKNVSLRRFYSHYVFAKNVKRYLQTRKKPDLVYCSVPSLDVALVAAKYAKTNDIRLIIDIQDLWPEAFKMVFNIPIISKLIFYPMDKMANYIYESADEVIAVSETYLNRALAINKNVKDGKVVFLGTELCCFDKAFAANKYQKKPNNEVWIAYAGTLGHSYDLTSVFDALKILQNNGIANLKFIVMGDGPLKINFEEYSRQKGISVVFTGRLPYAEMVGMLGVCDIAVNPISKGAAQSIINKHGDYAAAGLPVVNTQECIEYRNLVNEYQMGLNCNNSDASDLAQKLMLLLEDSELRKRMGKNGRKLAEEKFDRKTTYDAIYKLIRPEC